MWMYAPASEAPFTAPHSQGMVENVSGRGREHTQVLRFRRKVGEGVLEAAHTLARRSETAGLLRLVAQPLAPELHWQRPSSGRGVLRLPWRYPPSMSSPYNCNFTLVAHLITQMSDARLRYDLERQAVVPHLAHYW